METRIDLRTMIFIDHAFMINSRHPVSEATMNKACEMVQELYKKHKAKIVIPQVVPKDREQMGPDLVKPTPPPSRYVYYPPFFSPWLAKIIKWLFRIKE